MNYAKLAFTDTIKSFQEKLGSRGGYERMERMSVVDGLASNEIEFIEDRDSFYLASFGENGFPYIQHRGGPKGFIKVIDKNTIGIVDFVGNKQYISVGNISKHSKVALILMSYTHKARLKIYAEADILDLEENPEIYDFLKPSDYKFRPERMMLFTIKAFDWNCPQHITARFTASEIEEAFAPQKKYIEDLEKQIKELKEKISNK
jgi:uncharacterized protein